MKHFEDEIHLSHNGGIAQYVRNLKEVANPLLGVANEHRDIEINNFSDFIVKINPVNPQQRNTVIFEVNNIDNFVTMTNVVNIQQGTTEANKIKRVVSMKITITIFTRVMRTITFIIVLI